MISAPNHPYRSQFEPFFFCQRGGHPKGEYLKYNQGATTAIGWPAKMVVVPARKLLSLRAISMQTADWLSKFPVSSL